MDEFIKIITDLFCKIKVTIKKFIKEAYHFNQQKSTLNNMYSHLIASRKKELEETQSKLKELKQQNSKVLKEIELLNHDIKNKTFILESLQELVARRLD